MIKTDTQKQIKIFLIATILLTFLCAFIANSPSEIFTGMLTIVTSRDILITDYFELVGIGPALFNAALLMSIALFDLLASRKLNLNGLSIATVMIMGGFGLFGKNVINIMPILAGVFIYCKTHNEKFTRYIYTAYLATGVAPIVSELWYILPFNIYVNVATSVLVGLLIGMIIPVLASHTTSIHMGYNLFNVGFAVGVLALCLVSIFRSFGCISEPNMLWKTGINPVILAVMLTYFALMIVYGLWLNGGDFKSALEITKHPGKAIADFVLMDGFPATVINMGLVGIICTIYIVLINGDLNGPVIGSIITVVGFSAFGVHPKNYAPVLLGVFLTGLLNIYGVNTPSVQLAALFVCALAPIAGQFGFIPGLIAGFLHLSIVTHIGVVYTGLNLYNNGFAAGFVALIMLPSIESFIKRKKERTNYVS